VGLALCLALLLHAPSLGWGLFADDWGMRLALEHPEHAGTMRPWNLYDFGDAASFTAAYFDEGVPPWWLDPAWKMRFFRPVSSLVLTAEHALFGRNAALHHAAGLCWHALTLWLAWRLFRALGLGGGVALLALGLLALEDGSSTTVGWIANRNAVLEGVCTAAALLAAVRARESGSLARVGLALVCAALAAGCKESGLAALCGTALVLATGSARGARRGALAAAGLALAYLAGLAACGYSVRSEFYPTPWGDPFAWGRNALGLLTAGLVGTLGPYPVDALVMLPESYAWLVGGAVLVLALLARSWGRALRTLELGPCLAAFALLALLPQASAPPSDRLLYVPALGLAPITAAWLARGRHASGRGASGRGTRVAAWLVLACALPLSAAALVARGLYMRDVSGALNRAVLEAELDPAPPARRDVLLLSSPSALVSLGPLAAWRFHHPGEENTRFHGLQFGRRGLRWTRLDERSSVLESLDEPFVASLFEGVFRARSTLLAGDSLRTSGYTFLPLEEGHPRRLRVEAAAALEDPRFVFLHWSGGRWRRVQPPGVGEVLELAAGEPLRPHLP
jgi:hypothetical protein